MIKGGLFNIAKLYSTVWLPLLLYPYKSNRMSVCLLSDLNNWRNYMVLIYSEASYMSMEGL